MRVVRSHLLVALPLAAFLFLACTKHDDCASLATCAAASDDGGSSEGSTITPDDDHDAGADAAKEYPPVPPPPNCDPLADPTAPGAAACLDDAYALFVDATAGSDQNAGTKTKPLRTLLAATDRDRLAGRPRIYVSIATQEGNFVLPPRVTLAGGYTSADWSHPPGQTTNLVGAAGGPPTLFVSETTEEIALADVSVSAPTKTVSGESSIGVFIAAARARVYRLNIHTGKGAAGVRPGAKSNFRFGAGIGASASAAMPGGATECRCALHGTTTGGAGGKSGEPGLPGTSDPVASAGSRSGEGGTAACTDGQPGGDGAGGKGGAAAPVAGVIDADGWHPSNGGDGAAGEPGGGGGGGGGSSGNGGGGGGCGGCGGAGGGGGLAGGSSIGIVAYKATIALFATVITTDEAGAGGDGADAEGGAVGEVGGGGSCAGGRGGTGGGGGGGGGGAAGFSAAIARRGGAATQDTDTQFYIGASGAFGKGGVLGAAATAPSPLGAGQFGVSGEPGAAAPPHDPVVVFAE